MEQEFDPIDLKLIDILNNFLIEADNNRYRGNKDYTKRLKEEIGKLGLSLDYDVAASGFEDFESEWLYDLTWYKEDDENRLIHIELVIESEWGPKYNDIKGDFEKLLNSNANRRMMICQANEKNISTLFSKLETAINVYNGHKGDSFLIAIFDMSSETQFHFKKFIRE